MKSIKSRAFIFVLALALIITTLSSCSPKEESPALPYVAQENSELGCMELSYNGKIFRPYGVIGGSSMRDKKIGVSGGADGEGIFSIKNYDSTEWILAGDDVFMSGADMLYKEVSVIEISEYLKQYKQYDY